MNSGIRPIVADIVQRRDHVEADVAAHGRASIGSSGSCMRSGNGRWKIRPLIDEDDQDRAGASTPRTRRARGARRRRGRAGRSSRCRRRCSRAGPSGFAQARQHCVLEREHRPHHGAERRTTPRSASGRAAARARGAQRSTPSDEHRRRDQSRSRPRRDSRWRRATGCGDPTVGTKRLNPFVRFSCERLERKSIVAIERRRAADVAVGYKRAVTIQKTNAEPERRERRADEEYAFRTNGTSSARAADAMRPTRRTSVAVTRPSRRASQCGDRHLTLHGNTDRATGGQRVTLRDNAREHRNVDRLRHRARAFFVSHAARGE